MHPRCEEFEICWDCFHAKALLRREVSHRCSPHAEFQSSRASPEKSEEGAFVWHKQSS